MESERDELDRLIDCALATYSEAEPLAGLDQRVLERVRMADAARNPRLWWTWAAIFVSAAVLVMITVNRPHFVGQVGNLRRVDNPPQPSTYLPPPTPVTNRRAEYHPAPHRRTVPKPSQFPTPVPLTPEERALLTLARLEVQAPTNPRPIEIEPIEIAPLRTTEDQ